MAENIHRILVAKVTKRFFGFDIEPPIVMQVDKRRPFLTEMLEKDERNIRANLIYSTGTIELVKRGFEIPDPRHYLDQAIPGKKVAEVSMSYYPFTRVNAIAFFVDINSEDCKEST